MPTFTTVPLESLLELRAPDSLKKPLFSRGQEDSNPNPNPNPNQRSGRPRHLYISPTLYATPEQAPIPEYASPDPFSFSPYIVNHKHRRGGGNSEVPDSPSSNEGGGFNFEEEVGDNFGNENIDANDDGDEGFVDTKSESMSVGSEVGMDDFLVGKQFESRSSVSAQGNFFDANDDFSSDGFISNTPSYGSRTESELLATRLSILEEIERRKCAEETLIVMCSQWERIGNLMSRAGLTFPAPPTAGDKNDLIDKFFQVVVAARFVGEAVGRGQASAEAEEAAATIIESKDQEIVRLRDRLQYYETVYHELSQRKLVDVARRQQEKKIRSRRRWIWWSFMGLSIAIGASYVAYSYDPHASKYLPSLESGDGDLTDASCVGPCDTT